MNNVCLMGRITNDLTMKETPGGIKLLNFSLAVDRNYIKQGEERQTDFINCIAWRQTAEFIGKYFAKGRMIAVKGRLQSRKYTDEEGITHHVTEVCVEEVYFTGEPKKGDD